MAALPEHMAPTCPFLPTATQPLSPQYLTLQYTSSSSLDWPLSSFRSSLLPISTGSFTLLLFSLNPHLGCCQNNISKIQTENWTTWLFQGKLFSFYLVNKYLLSSRTYLSDQYSVDNVAWTSQQGFQAHALCFHHVTYTNADYVTLHDETPHCHLGYISHHLSLKHCISKIPVS